MKVIYVAKLSKERIKYRFGTITNFATVYRVNYNNVRRWIHTGVSLDIYLANKIPLKYVDNTTVKRKESKTFGREQKNAYKLNTRYFFNEDIIKYKYKTWKNFAEIHNLTIMQLVKYNKKGVMGKTLIKLDLPPEYMQTFSGEPLEKRLLRVKENNGN